MENTYVRIRFHKYESAETYSQDGRVIKQTFALNVRYYDNNRKLMLITQYYRFTSEIPLYKKKKRG